jgi:hypothetical protein
VRDPITIVRRHHDGVVEAMKSLRARLKNNSRREEALTAFARRLVELENLSLVTSAAARIEWISKLVPSGIETFRFPR